MSFVGPLVVLLLMVPPGLKLLHQSRHEGASPEFWAGLYFLGAGIGMPLRIMGATHLQTNESLAHTLNLGGHIGLFVATLGLTVFTWRVFHPQSSRVAALAWGLIALQVVTTGITILGGFVNVEDSSAIVATNSMRVLPSWWACFESIRYWRTMRRRMSLSLADPVTTNRFALWAIWTGAFAVLPTAALVLRVLVPLWLGTTEWGDAAFETMHFLLGILRVVMLMAGLVGAVALVLSFFPPRRYTLRLERRRGEAEAS